VHTATISLSLLSVQQIVHTKTQKFNFILQYICQIDLFYPIVFYHKSTLVSLDGQSEVFARTQENISKSLLKPNKVLYSKHHINYPRKDPFDFFYRTERKIFFPQDKTRINRPSGILKKTVYLLGKRMS